MRRRFGSMPSALDDEMSDQFYRSSTQVGRRMEGPEIFYRANAVTKPANLRTTRSASVAIKKNISKSWHFFKSQKRVVRNHKNTTNSPQQHHKKPSRKHPFFTKPLQKHHSAPCKHFYGDLRHRCRCHHLPHSCDDARGNLRRRRSGSLHCA
jgi:hypothetical protein